VAEYKDIFVDSDEEDHPSIIPSNEYLPELEKQVAYFVRNTPDYPVNKKLYTRAKIPERLSDRERKEWEKQEINRCKMGYDGMVGKQYTYFNYGWIQQIAGGKISPHYRVCDNAWYEKIERVQGIRWDDRGVPVNESQGKGLICVKRRRGGFSWKEALDSLHDSTFIPFFNTGMNSMSERDSIILFNKVKFLYDNFPDFLRATTTAGKTKSSMLFGYYKRDAKGNKILKGTQSNIVVVPPTDSAYEGWMLNKWACDEAGKITNLDEMWTYTEDCMMQETLRKGTPVLFGTSGDIGTVGRALKEMYENADVYNLERFFFGGWMGILCDKYGNDLKEHAIRWMLYERERRKKLSLKKQAQFKQKYPLTIKEAFADSGVTGLGDPIRIETQSNILIAHPVPAIRGKFHQHGDGKIEFINTEEGMGTMFGQPSGLANANLAGCDPADHDDTEGTDISDLSMLIGSKHMGSTPPKILFDLTGRPPKLSDYYQQASLGLQYYSARVLIERQRYRMISELEAMGLKYLLYRSPQKIMKLTGGRVNTIGVNMTDSFTGYVEGLVEKYVDDYAEFIPTLLLLKDLGKYHRDKKPDRVVAFMLWLAMLWEDTSSVTQAVETKRKLTMPTLRRINGVITRVPGKEIIPRGRNPQQGSVGATE